MGNVRALVNLGISYLDGDFGEKNTEKAKTHFKKAADKGNIDGKIYYIHHFLENIQGDSEDDYILAI